MEFKNILKRAILNTIEKWDSESSKEMLVFSVGNTIDMFFDMQETTTTTTTSKKRERSPSPSESSSSSEDEEEEPDFELFDDDDEDPDNGGNYYYYDHDEEALRLLITNGYSELQTSDWFDRRYGRVLKGIRANMGAQNKNQADAQAHFDALTHGSNEVIVERHPGKTKCCFCNMSKACNQTLKTPSGNFPIARCCGKLASALIEFYRILKQLVDENNDGSGFITLDRAFKAVMDASEKR